MLVSLITYSDHTFTAQTLLEGDDNVYLYHAGASLCDVSQLPYTRALNIC